MYMHLFRSANLQLPIPPLTPTSRQEVLKGHYGYVYQERGYECLNLYYISETYSVFPNSKPTFLIQNMYHTYCHVHLINVCLYLTLHLMHCSKTSMLHKHLQKKINHPNIHDLVLLLEFKKGESELFYVLAVDNFANTSIHVSVKV